MVLCVSYGATYINAQFQEFVMKKHKVSSIVLATLFLSSLWCIAGVFTACAGSTPFAYKWTITLPNDQPYRKCRIVAHSVSYYSDHVLDRGDSWEWSPPANYPPGKLTYVEAVCSRSGSAGSDLVKIQNRTCTGVDSTGSVAGDPRCASNIRVKICRKISGTEAGDFSYGFCPD